MFVFLQKEEKIKLENKFGGGWVAGWMADVELYVLHATVNKDMHLVDSTL
jgi:hypothetical protein